jgi:subtilisin family serine protease
MLEVQRDVDGVAGVRVTGGDLAGDSIAGLVASLSADPALAGQFAALGYDAEDGVAPDADVAGLYQLARSLAPSQAPRLLAADDDAAVIVVPTSAGQEGASDLVEAVEWCIHNQIDVISMSLGSANPSQVLAMALRDAYDRGITSVAAVGNENSNVAYPAAYPTVLGVGALGRFGTFPEDSAHMLKVGNTRDFQGGLFAASFTNFGQEVDVCAPGVAVLSTVPTGYAAWDGTSMACPMVSALVALILEANPAIRTGDPGQPEAVKAMLYKSSVNLGMPPHIQGRGFPLATMALAAAQPSPRRRVWDFPRAGTMY